MPPGISKGSFLHRNVFFHMMMLCSFHSEGSLKLLKVSDRQCSLLLLSSVSLYFLFLSVKGWVRVCTHICTGGQEGILDSNNSTLNLPLLSPMHLSPWHFMRLALTDMYIHDFPSPQPPLDCKHSRKKGSILTSQNSPQEPLCSNASKKCQFRGCLSGTVG